MYDMYVGSGSDIELKLICKVKNINDFNKYIDNLCDRYNKLDNKDKRKFIKDLNIATVNKYLSYIDIEF